MRTQTSGRGTLFTIEFTSSSDSGADPPPTSPPKDPDPPPSPREQHAPVKVTAEKVHIVPRHSSDDDAVPEVSTKVDAFVIEDEPPPRSQPRSQLPRPVVRATPVATALSKMYVLKRSQKKHLNGKSIFFSIEDGPTKLFSAKFKRQRVRICAGERVPRLSEESDAIMIVGKDCADFSFRETAVSMEAMTLKFMSPANPAEIARKLDVSFHVDIEGLPGRKLISKNPKLNAEGKVVHDFEGRFAIDSVKNAVLAATVDGPPMLCIRKAGNDVLEMEARFPIEPKWIFAIGIASFLTKVM
jgi:hypothetical protein